MEEDKRMRKIFIIAPYFPPSAMPPSQRVRLIVKHAASLGFYPVVFTVAPRYREEREDPWMTELAGTAFDLVVVDCMDQHKTRKLGVGDLGLRMFPYLYRALKREAKKYKPDYMLYPVPPWYVLMVAPHIKKITGVPYAIDFIDPWVHDRDVTETSIKKRLSHWISRRMESRVCKHASIIYSVSEGINENLLKRYPYLSGKEFFAIPYGAEQDDFEILRKQLPPVKNQKIIIRYIGAIWLDCYPVLDGFMPALAETAKEYSLSIEFYGTSYAGEGLARPQMDKWVNENGMQDYTSESPLRVPYRQAVELTLSSDLLILMGGMLPYYAASKLMGLLVSKKPFVAFVHEDSFPARLLKEINYPYVATYSGDPFRLPVTRIGELAGILKRAIVERENFKGVDLSHPAIQAHTALGMTKAFLEPINKKLA